MTTGYKTLLRVISDVRCEDRIDTATFPISTNHQNTGLPSLNQGFQQGLHTFVEEAISLGSVFFLIEALEFRDWEVTEKNCCTFQLFMTGVLADVPNSDVYRPSLFIASESGKVRLV